MQQYVTVMVLATALNVMNFIPERVFKLVSNLKSVLILLSVALDVEFFD